MINDIDHSNRVKFNLLWNISYWGERRIYLAMYLFLYVRYKRYNGWNGFCHVKLKFFLSVYLWNRLVCHTNSLVFTKDRRSRGFKTKDVISFTIKTQRKVIIQLIMQKREWTEYLQLHLTWTKMGIVCLSYQDVLQWNRNFNLRENSGLYKNQRYWTMIRRKEKRKSRILDICYFFLIYRWTFKRAKYKREPCTCKIRPSWCYTPNHWLKINK